MAEKVLNIGEPIDLSGRKVHIREISWLSIKRHLRALYDLLIKIRDENPEFNWTEVKVEGALETVFRSTMTAFEGVADEVEAILSESSALTKEEIEGLTASDFTKLLRAFLEQHATVIKDFFDLRAMIRSVFGLDKPGGNESGKPKAGKRTRSQA